MTTKVKTMGTIQLYTNIDNIKKWVALPQRTKLMLKEKFLQIITHETMSTQAEPETISESDTDVA